MKYKCEVGSMCTRLIVRHITINANNEEEAKQKAIDKYVELEYKNNPASVDAGTPQVDDIYLVE
jgi:hypothetical protein